MVEGCDGQRGIANPDPSVDISSIGLSIIVIVTIELILTIIRRY